MNTHFSRSIITTTTLILLASSASAQTGPDFAENNAALWGTFASDNAPASTSLETSRIKLGASSIRFDTQSGFDTGVRFPAAGGLNFDASTFSHLTFWEYPENSTPIGWQGDQPVVVISTNDGAGVLTLTPGGQLTSNFTWKLFKVPLAGGAGWTATSTGVVDLTDVDQIEIHHDTWDAGFSITFDGVRFMNISPGGLPPAGPPAPFGVDPDAIEPRVLLYIFNPIMENMGSRRMNEVYGWRDPEELAREVVRDLRDSSHGRARYNVVEAVVADEYPRFQDGFQHTDATFAADWAAGVFHNSTFDYVGFAQSLNLPARVDAGEIDEVWVYAPPIAGMWESCMAGQGAYWINGPTYPAAGGQRAYVIMGWNFERGVGEAIHSYGHRAESILAYQYGGWAPNRDTTWNRFALLDSQSPGQGGVGNVHFPVNGESDYDYANTRVVSANADAWWNYPNLHDATRPMNVTEWSPAGVDTQREYLNWWYAHMPHAPGRGPDQYLANWWRYLCDVDQFKAGNGRLEGTIGIPTVSITSPGDGATVRGLIAIRAAAEVDGALGRVDLYVDGNLYATDSLWPYVFLFDADELIDGSHQIEVRAYELQNGTEATAGITLNVLKCLADVTSIGGPPLPPDGQLTVDDIIAFVNQYGDGCP